MSSKRPRPEGSRAMSSRKYDQSRFISADAAAKFHAWDTRTVIPERGLRPDIQLDGNLSAMIAAKGWRSFTEQSIDAVVPVVKEFYANLQEHNSHEVLVRGQTIAFVISAINNFFNLPDYAINEGYSKYISNTPDYDEIITTLCKPGTRWKFRESGAITFSHSALSRYGKAWYAFICARLMPKQHVSDVTKERAALLYGIVTGMNVNVGRVIHDSVLRAWKGATTGGFPHPSLISALCRQAGVTWNNKEEVAFPSPIIDHALIMRYTVWDGGESHPSGLGYIMVPPSPPPPAADQSTSMDSLSRKFDHRFMQLQLRLNQQHEDLGRQNTCLATRQAEIYSYIVNSNRALTDMFAAMNPNAPHVHFPVPPALSQYPPSDPVDAADEEENEDGDDGTDVDHDN